MTFYENFKRQHHIRFCNLGVTVYLFSACFNQKACLTHKYTGREIFVSLLSVLFINVTALLTTYVCIEYSTLYRTTTSVTRSSKFFVGVRKPFAWMGLIFGLVVFFELIIHFRRRYGTNEVITLSTAQFNRHCVEDHMELVLMTVR